MAAKYTLLLNKATGERKVRINKTGEIISELNDSVKYLELRKKAIAAQKRSAKDDLMESCGLTKVRGAVSGKIYWE